VLAETRAAFALEAEQNEGQAAVIDGGDRTLVFERTVPIIHAHRGHIDKYVGDGLLAVFDAPRRQEDHADQTLVASQIGMYPHRPHTARSFPCNRRSRRRCPGRGGGWGASARSWP
jgi:hypothetical protein